MIPDVTTVDSTHSDEEFLFQIYSNVREEEVAAWGWTEAQREGFLRMQHRAQQIEYRSQFPEASFLIIRVGGTSVGSMIVNRTPEEISLVDIALLSGYRSKGIGSSLLDALRREAILSQRPLRLSVRKDNRASNLYGRLGFAVVADDGIYQRLELHSS